jgi:hypothetical protein
MTDPFRSKRLQFTAIDPERDVDVYYDMTQDSNAQMQLTFEVPRVRPRCCQYTHHIDLLGYILAPSRVLACTK